MILITRREYGSDLLSYRKDVVVMAAGGCPHGEDCQKSLQSVSVMDMDHDSGCGSTKESSEV